MTSHPIFVVIAVGLVLAGLLLNGHLVPAGDNATYIVLGQSLASLRGYRMVSDPRLPAMALYPPAFPGLLAGILLLTGSVSQPLALVGIMKAVSVLLFLATLALCHQLLRFRDSQLGLPVVLLMAVSPGILHFATEVGTEIPYLFLSLLALWFFQRYLWKPTRSRLVMVIGILVLAFYVRSVAVVLALSMVSVLVLRRRIRAAFWLAVFFGLFIVPWLLYANSLPGTGTSVGLGRGYLDLYFSSDPYGVELASTADLWARVWQNLRIYGLDILPDVLFPHASRVAGLLGPLSTPFLATFGTLVLIGFASQVRRGHASEIYVALYFASCLGYLWAQSRLLVPVMPFAIYYWLNGMRVLLRRLTGRRRLGRGAALAVTCSALALSALVADARAVHRNLRFAMGQPVEVWYGQDPEWASYLAAMRWVESHATPDAVVVCRKADLHYLLTGNLALEYPYDASSAVLREFCEENAVDLLIEDAFTWTRTTDQYLRPALQSWKETDSTGLALAYESPPPRTRVWRTTW